MTTRGSAHGRPAASDDATPSRRGVHATLALLGGDASPDGPPSQEVPREPWPSRSAVLRIELVLDERTLREVDRAIASAYDVVLSLARGHDTTEGGSGPATGHRTTTGASHGVSIAPPADADERSPRGTMTIGELRIDFGAHEVWRDGRRVPLRPREFALLGALIRANGCAVSRECLLQEVWGYTKGVVSRTLDTHVRSLRRKLEPTPANPRHLITVRTVGYRFAR
jgi:DNA-binding response OmpR family regulator